ncbi:PAS domain-containing protein, partial [Candidatus Aerophobetes bacterium]|nr:PAS domain-containing protein [Candidatus Aerophobetes bacterium]
MEKENKKEREYKRKLENLQRKFLISERLRKDFKDKEKKAKEKLDYFEMIIDTLVDPFLVLNEGFKVAGANFSFYNRFNLQKREVKGRCLFKIGKLCPTILSLKEPLKRVFRKGVFFENFEVEHQTKEGEKSTFIVTARRLPEEKSNLILLSMRDITSQKKIENTLKKILGELEESLEKIVSLLG